MRSGQQFLFPTLLPNVAVHLSGKRASKPRWWESWTSAVLPTALHSDGTYHAPSQHRLGWIEATWDHLLWHPAHARQTSPEIFHSGQHFHPGKDKREEQCQLKHSGREATTQATPQAAECDRSSNVASFLCWHKRQE